MDDKLYSKLEAAEFLKISIATLEKLMKSKKIAFTKLGDERSNRVVFEKSDLNNLLRNQKKWTIRDSGAEILKLIPEGALPKLDIQGHFDLGPFDAVMRLCENALEKMQQVLAAASWLEAPLVEQTKILVKNVEAVRDLCIYALPEVGPDLCERLAGREISLFESEIKPNLRLAKKYFDPGKGKAVQIIARPANTMPNHVTLRSVHVGADSYELSETEWRPIPEIDEAEAQSFFNCYHGAANLRIAPQTKKPVSRRERQAIEKAITDDLSAARVKIESELLGV